MANYGIYIEIWKSEVIWSGENHLELLLHIDLKSWEKMGSPSKYIQNDMKDGQRWNSKGTTICIGQTKRVQQKKQKQWSEVQGKKKRVVSWKPKEWRVSCRLKTLRIKYVHMTQQ